MTFGRAHSFQSGDLCQKVGIVPAKVSDGSVKLELSYQSVGRPLEDGMRPKQHFER